MNTCIKYTVAIDLTEKIEESLPREIILKMIRAMKLLENVG